MFDNKNRFVIENYQQKPTFSSFLPGVAGAKGIPAWVYYNNRGQAVCSFGAKDKDHAIMEFSAAHTAYQNNARTGFRTFARVNEEYRELFCEDVAMHIGTAELVLQQQSGELLAQVSYCGLPEHRVAGLLRTLTVTNTSDRTIELELLDGMPAVVCYGVGQDALKNMAQLAKAWMQSEYGEDGTTRFAVRASMEDTACVTRVEGVNFCYAIDGQGNVLRPIVQPSVILGQDTGFAAAGEFAKQGMEALCAQEQVMQNLFPCCFVPCKARLAPGQQVRILSLYGQAENREVLTTIVNSITGTEWFDRCHRRAVEIGEKLAQVIHTRTSNPVFDAYCRQTCVDNLLRGGTPVFFEEGEKSSPFYLYSRKHGDPEREYNYFSVGGEYYAQGNGNFRDVNQNRRCDVIFHPKLKDSTIRMFYELIQSDGYNPLVILPGTFSLELSEQEALLASVPVQYRAQAQTILSSEFTPGKLAMAAETWGMTAEQQDAFVNACIARSNSEPNAEFGEGYWTDHWTYNLDLVESYLSVYPENEEQLLFSGRDYRWYASKAAVLPRERRYVETEGGLRQYHSITKAVKQASDGKWLLEQNGTVARSSLIEKLILLCLIKAATLDCEGMGVEMEGGKPGWYDALNGLPGLFGSSMAETCELNRMLHFTAAALEKFPRPIELYQDIAWLLEQVNTGIAFEDLYTRWETLSQVREEYRLKTETCIASQRVVLDSALIAVILRKLEALTEQGMRKAERMGGGIMPTYFRFEAEGTIKTENGILPGQLHAYALPHFLEGAVRRLKTGLSQEEKRTLAQRVKESDLYDHKLKMYKVNASLANTTFEVGRTCAFTPGWLENESIWLHMEYKYLLELLKSGLYSEFFEAFHDAAVPFLNPDIYGRSPLENVSFIASSANPNPQDHGRGFVARLSGSTAEFLQIWNLMFFGAHPFVVGENGLELTFAPALPEYLVPADGIVQVTFLGSIPVKIHCKGSKALVCGEQKVVKWLLNFADGTQRTIEGNSVCGTEAEAVRSGLVTAIEVYFE